MQTDAKPASKSTVEILVRRPRCQAAASILHGEIVHHDKGLYPAYCILEEGHDGPHKNRKSWWPNAPHEPAREKGLTA